MNLRPGDLLLYRISGSSNWLDRLIGWGQRIAHQAPTKAAYCHVAIVGPDTESIYEAIWPRIHNTPIDIGKIQKTIVLEAYRVRGATPEQISRVMASAAARVGERYDALAILSFGLLQLGRATVCSEYAYQSFLDAGIVLCHWSSLESPDDIAASPLLERIQ